MLCADGLRVNSDAVTYSDDAIHAKYTYQSTEVAQAQDGKLEVRQQKAGMVQQARAAGSTLTPRATPRARGARWQRTRQVTRTMRAPWGALWRRYAARLRRGAAPGCNSSLKPPEVVCGVFCSLARRSAH